MGDRGNIVMKQSGDHGKIFFYTHYDGSDLPRILQAALVRGEDRWDDEPYLGRIIFCELVKNDVLGNLGYGITTYQTDNEHPVLYVDSNSQTVQCGNDPKFTWTFKEFIELDISKEFADF